jgi:hypothetical protein
MGTASFFGALFSAAKTHGIGSSPKQVVLLVGFIFFEM